MEFIVVIGTEAGLDQAVELRYGPAIQRKHLFRCHKLVRIETVKVTEAIARGIAEFQIALRELLKDFLRAAHIRAVICGRRPEAHNVRAEIANQVGRINAVSERLVHGLALTVNRPAVGQALLEGSALPQRADTGQQA